MKTKKGTASRVKLSTALNHRLNRMMNRLKSNWPVRMPIAPNTMAVPANENATGYPASNNTRNTANMKMASHSRLMKCFLAVSAVPVPVTRFSSELPAP